MKLFSGYKKTNPNKASFKRGGYAALRRAYKKTLLFALNLVKWTLGEMRKSQIEILDTGCWILDLIPLLTISIENRFKLCER